MPTTAELMRKENEALKKAQELHRTRLKKLEANETKRLFKILKTNNYFDYEFSDEEVTVGIQTMVLMKNPSAVFPENKNKSSANADKDSKKSVGEKTNKTISADLTEFTNTKSEQTGNNGNDPNAPKDEKNEKANSDDAKPKLFSQIGEKR